MEEENRTAGCSDERPCFACLKCGVRMANLIPEAARRAAGHRPGMEPVGESPTEKAPGYGLFRPEEIPALLMGTWLAAGGFAPITVRRICRDAGIDPDRTQAIVDAYVTKGGPNVY